MLRYKKRKLTTHVPRQLENFQNSPNVQNATSKFIANDHGTDGPVGAGLPQVSLAIDQIGLNAQQELSSEFKYNQDVNSGDMIGFSTSSDLHPSIDLSPGLTSPHRLDPFRRK